jgi:hypothetical protein
MKREREREPENDGESEKRIRVESRDPFVFEDVVFEDVYFRLFDKCTMVSALMFGSACKESRNAWKAYHRRRWSDPEIARVPIEIVPILKRGSVSTYAETLHASRIILPLETTCFVRTKPRKYIGEIKESIYSSCGIEGRKLLLGGDLGWSNEIERLYENSSSCHPTSSFTIGGRWACEATTDVFQGRNGNVFSVLNLIERIIETKVEMCRKYEIETKKSDADASSEVNECRKLVCGRKIARYRRNQTKDVSKAVESLCNLMNAAMISKNDAVVEEMYARYGSFCLHFSNATCLEIMIRSGYYERFTKDAFSGERCMSARSFCTHAFARGDSDNGESTAKDALTRCSDCVRSRVLGKHNADEKCFPLRTASDPTKAILTFASRLSLDELKEAIPHLKRALDNKSKSKMLWMSSSMLENNRVRRNHKVLRRAWTGVLLSGDAESFDVKREKLESLLEGLSDIAETKRDIEGDIDSSYSGCGDEFDDFISGKKRTLPKSIGHGEARAITRSTEIMIAEYCNLRSKARCEAEDGKWIDWILSRTGMRELQHRENSRKTARDAARSIPEQPPSFVDERSLAEFDTAALDTTMRSLFETPVGVTTTTSENETSFENEASCEILELIRSSVSLCSTNLRKELETRFTSLVPGLGDESKRKDAELYSSHFYESARTGNVEELKRFLEMNLPAGSASSASSLFARSVDGARLTERTDLMNASSPSSFKCLYEAGYWKRELDDVVALYVSESDQYPLRSLVRVNGSEYPGPRFKGFCECVVNISVRDLETLVLLNGKEENELSPSYFEAASGIWYKYGRYYRKGDSISCDRLLGAREFSSDMRDPLVYAYLFDELEMPLFEITKR